MPIMFFGFDVTHSHIVGTERFLMALIEEPEWCMDMFDAELTSAIKLCDYLWDQGIKFDGMYWWDDMGYKNNQFFSLTMYRELVKPFHKRAIEWAHQKGIKAWLHSCGDITPFIPDFVEMGLDALNPLEVKAGVDPIALKAKFGDKLVLHGGVNAVYWTDLPKMEANVRSIVPQLKKNGGYVFASDHSIPDNVPYANLKYIVNLVKELGRY